MNSIAGTKQKNRLRRIILVITLTIVGNSANAQSHMRIHHKGGGHSDVPIEQIDSITFVNGRDLWVVGCGVIQRQATMSC